MKERGAVTSQGEAPHVGPREKKVRLTPDERNALVRTRQLVAFGTRDVLQDPSLLNTKATKIAQLPGRTPLLIMTDLSRGISREGDPFWTDDRKQTAGNLLKVIYERRIPVEEAKTRGISNLHEIQAFLEEEERRREAQQEARKEGTKPSVVKVDWEKREAEVLTLYAQGRSFSEVGDTLSLTKSMAKNTLARLYRKYGKDNGGVTGVAAVVKHGLAEGLIDGKAIVAHCEHPEEFDRLTIAEAKIVGHLMSGLNREEIAQREKWSHARVMKQLSILYNKVGTKGERHTIAVAYALGFGEEEK